MKAAEICQFDDISKSNNQKDLTEMSDISNSVFGKLSLPQEEEKMPSVVSENSFSKPSTPKKTFVLPQI